MTYSYQVPLSYTINVSLAATSAGLADFNTNSIAIFTNDPAGFAENYQAYLSPSGVKSDFGSNSLTYKMANALFTPVPNFRSGGGNLYVFPFSGTNATAGTFTTDDISANVTAFKSVTDGSLNITIDGNSNLVSGLDFSRIQSIADIVKVLQSKNLDINIEADGNTIKFTSRKYGSASGVVISTITESVVVDISTASYLDAGNGTAVSGTNSGGGSLSDAVADALQQVYFGAVLTTQYQDADTFEANASAIQSLDCNYFEVITSLKDIAAVGGVIKTAGNSKTRTLAYSMADAKVAIATYATIAQSVNYNASNTANTLNLKTLTGISPDKNLSDTYLLSAQTNGVDVYGNTGGLACVYSNDNNGYTDDIVNQLWFKKAIEVAGFNYLRQTNTKIPQTEAGMTGLKNAYTQICKKSVNNGMTAPGTWNTAIPFGDPEDFKKNIEEYGYYVYSLPISQQTQAEREARKAPVCQIAIKMSGAFHSSDVIVNVER